MLTSTLTKPTTMNPTLSCRRRVNLLENIDISPFPAPRARIVTLEPVSKRSRPKTKRKSSGLEDTDRSVNGSSDRPPLSPVHSNVSSSSRPSNSSQSFQIVDPGRSEARSTTPSVSDKTIMAKTEVTRAGVLPGDTLPVIVTVNHCKQVHSAHGIIVTLYRQGRIDLHPAIPVGNQSNGKKPVYEDVYPRSRTGLGGLSLGTSRASSMFRKDLSQTFAPLVVDPNTLTAVVKTSVRIPENAFPTITRVPGGMINFRYYVEVVADLRGKLTSPERFLPRFNMVSAGKAYSPRGQIIKPETGANSVTTNWADNILDTDQIRREKGVIAVAFEVVVGTHDSQRGKDPGPELPSPHPQPTPENGDWDPNIESDGVESGQDYGFPQVPYNEFEPAYQSLGEMVAPPEVEEPVDEKTQIRRAEETLLPSQPDHGGSSDVPTAPVLPEDDLQDYQHLPAPDGLQATSAESVQTVISPGGPNAPGAGDDKQELERQRLMQEASAPTHGENGEGPSAPVLDDEDQLVGGTAHGDESLPQYQR